MDIPGECTVDPAETGIAKGGHGEHLGALILAAVLGKAEFLLCLGQLKRADQQEVALTRPAQAQVTGAERAELKG